MPLIDERTTSAHEGPGTFFRLLAGLVLTVITTTALAGCRDTGPDEPATTRAAHNATTPPGCDFRRSDQETAGGPLQRESNALTFSMNYISPGTFQDATVIPLLNETSQPLLIDTVDLVADPKTAPLGLGGTFVAPPTVVQRVGHTRNKDRYEAAAGYCLMPLKDDRAPILTLRIGPSIPNKSGGHSLSRNNSVNVHYRTSDGHRYVAALPYRFEYPNHRDERPLETRPTPHSNPALGADCPDTSRRRHCRVLQHVCGPATALSPTNAGRPAAHRGDRRPCCLQRSGATVVLSESMSDPRDDSSAGPQRRGGG